MENSINLFGEVGSEITLENVMNQVSSLGESNELIVNVHSSGGSVFEGLAIYNYLKGLNREVTTVGHGLVASIASVIFLAGSKRVINGSTRFLIHLPSGASRGNAEDLESTAKQLRQIENELADIYALETNMTKEEAIAQMKLDTFSDNSNLEEQGFVTELREIKAVAILDSNFKNEKMSNEVNSAEAKSLLDELKTFVASLVKPKFESKVVQDATGEEIDFQKVEASAEIALEDEATINGLKAEGDYVMPNGSTYKFENGLLVAIEEAKPEPTNELEDLNKEITAKNEKIEELTNALAELEASNKTELESVESSYNENLSTLTAKIDELGKTIGSDFNYENTADPAVEKQGSTRKLFKD